MNFVSTQDLSDELKPTPFGIRTKEKSKREGKEIKS